MSGPSPEAAGATLAYEPPGAAIARRLLAPAERVALEALPGRWFHQAVELRLAGQGQRAGDPALPGKLRGALGAELLRGASPAAIAGAPRPWDPPCALDVLLREQGRITPRLALPRPFVLAVERRGEDLAVRLTLFGFACDWMPAAAEALSAALRHGLPGVAGSAIGGRRLVGAEAASVPADSGGAVLDFRSPVWFRGPEGGFPADFPGLVANLGNRVSAMARWQDSLLEADWPALKAAAAAVRLDARALEPRVWRRASRRQGGRAIPMRGLLGPVYLEGPLAAFLPLLALAATCHAGSHAALGLGRFALET